MEPLNQLLLEAAAMHRGNICPGQILGVRMAMLGCKLLHIDDPKHSSHLIVYVEIDRCMADAVAAVTGCRLGKRTLKYVDYGKCACTFLHTATGHAVRISARDDARERVWHYVSKDLPKTEAQRHAYSVMPDEELFTVQEVLADLSPFDLPGKPISHTLCAICGEGINDGREVRLNGQVMCRACANGGYYYPKHQPRVWRTASRSLP